ncbi:hypothetical protein [Streptomyces zagrosensis]|uniref:NAD(+)--protein-arginine ADP-ribosyltransferase n=1 Tax=Streptomyces zagrosensis TaxID=1042984 RepID=A0A7W9QIQ4_9ACTN|nr:hypothetical protein [Streptomyces zagrosensis]MBB5939697.1 hypothetical protein [Streptomyces zagrosensis]
MRRRGTESPGREAGRHGSAAASGADSGEASAFAVEEFGSVLLIRLPTDDMLGPADIEDLTRSLAPGDDDRTVTVVAGADEQSAAGLWPRLASLLDALREEGTTTVRLVMSGVGADRPGRAATARRIADAWNIEVIAPDGVVLVVPGGGLFVPGGEDESTAGSGWWRFSPGAEPMPLGPRQPAPTWQPPPGALLTRTRGGCRVAQIPAGLLIRPDGAPAPRPGDLCYAVPVAARTPVVLVGVPAADDVSADDVTEAVAALPSVGRDEVRIAPGGRRDVLGIGQSVADTLGSAVVVHSGPPLLSGGGGTGRPDARSTFADADGVPRWHPYVDAVLCRPQRELEAGAATGPEVLRWELPLTGPAGGGPGVVALSDRWHVAATRAGLWIGGHDGQRPPTTAQSVTPDGPLIEVGRPDEPLDASLWPELAGLLTALGPELCARARLRVHGTCADGGHELRRLAGQHALRSVRLATGSTPAPAPAPEPATAPARPAVAAPAPAPEVAPARAAGFEPAPIRAPVPAPIPAAVPAPVSASAPLVPAGSPVPASPPLVGADVPASARTVAVSTSGEGPPEPGPAVRPSLSGGVPVLGDPGPAASSPSAVAMDGISRARPPGAPTSERESGPRRAGEEEAPERTPVREELRSGAEPSPGAEPNPGEKPSPDPEPSFQEAGAEGAPGPALVSGPAGRDVRTAAPRLAPVQSAPPPAALDAAASGSVQPPHQPQSPLQPERAHQPQSAAPKSGSGPPVVPVAPGTPVTRATSPVLVLPPVPFVPGHASTEAEQAAFRTLAESQWERLGSAVARTLMRMPALRGHEQIAARADLIALQLYLRGTQSELDHEALRRALHSGDGRLLPYAACVASGLRRLPSFRGAVFRGAPSLLAVGGGLTPGRLLRDPGPVSGLPVESEGPSPGGARYVIWSVTGRRVRQLFDAPGAAAVSTSRDEVVFPPGTVFRVLDASTDGPGGEAPLFLLRELSVLPAVTTVRRDPLDDQDRAALVRLQETLSRHPAAVGPYHWPDRCAGPVGSTSD